MKDSAISESGEARREVSDAEIVQLALDWKLATQSELRGLMRSRRGVANPPPLLEVLVEKGLVTAPQAARLSESLAAGDKPQQKIPGYQLIEKLGQGGMGVVYKALQLSMDRHVAIKLLKPKLSQDAKYVERFLREAKLAARLSHNHIVQAIDAGEAYGHHYMVMEYVEGSTVGHLIRNRGPFEESEAVRIVLQIAQALDHASKRGMVHRDIKPENVMLTGDGVAKLADLGLARLREDVEVAESERGLLVGTPYYVSPEQIRGEEEIDSRADIYSLGATLYAMMSGKPPFDGEYAREVLVKHLETVPKPLNRIGRGVSDGLSVVVETMLAKNRQDRYPTPADLAFDLICLQSNQTPRLAQERISLRTLEELAEGEAVEERGSLRLFAGPARDAGKKGGGITYVLVAILIASIVANFALAFWR